MRSVDFEGTSLLGTGGRVDVEGPMDCTLGMSVSEGGAKDMWLPASDWLILPTLSSPGEEEEAWLPLSAPGTGGAGESFLLALEASVHFALFVAVVVEVVVVGRSGNWRGDGRLLEGDTGRW